MDQRCAAPGVIRHRMPVWLIRTALLLVLLASTAAADTRGKLTGRIADPKGQPVVGATVVILGTTLGAAADIDGNYVILNVPASIYDVRSSAVGYQSRVVKEVRVNAGQTTTLNVTLTEALIEKEEVVTIAQRPLVDTRQTSSVAILDKDDINILPVQSLADVVNLQAGVVDGHFRGGRIGEVQYQVDGVSVNNPYDNSSVIQLDKSVLQEVQVISGTFDAEYGQAMSGVVNAVLRSGSDERFDVSAEAYGGFYVVNGSDAAIYPHLGSQWLRPSFPGETAGQGLRNLGLPLPLQSYTVSLGGPTGLPETSFLVNIRRFSDNGYLYGERLFVPTDVSDFGSRTFRPGGDGKVIPLGNSEEYSGQMKIANHSITDGQLSYQFIGATGQSRPYNFAFRFNPDGMRRQNHTSVVHGIDWTQTITPTTFYTLNLRQNFFHYTDYAFDALDNPRYYAAGAPRGDANYELGATIQGYDIGRFEQKTNAFLVKGSLTSQVTPIHLVKAGFEGQLATVGFGSPGTLAYQILTGSVSQVYVVPDTLAQNLKSYHPVSMALFVQDRVEFTDFMIRVGLRLEYYDANTTLPSNLENPANAIQGDSTHQIPQSFPKRTSRKIALAPRLGVSYPITATGALYFSYGHFYQMPGLGNLYANSDYSVLSRLQASSSTFPLMGNPDIKPEFTAQYEFGFKQEFGRLVGVDLSVFYKDVRDLLGVEFIETYADAQYARFTNVDFGSVYGIKLSYDQRFSENFSASLNYTFQNAVGNSSDPRETFTRASAGEDPRPRQVSFDWDQRHTLNAALTLVNPNDYVMSAIIKYGSGSPYTPAIGSGFGAGLERNSEGKPAWGTVDVRAEKSFTFDQVRLNVFLRVFNVFDSRYGNGFVFSTTGSPYYSLTPATDRSTLADPSRFAAPRRFEIGFRVNL